MSTFDGVTLPVFSLRVALLMFRIIKFQHAAARPGHDLAACKSSEDERAAVTHLASRIKSKTTTLVIFASSERPLVTALAKARLLPRAVNQDVLSPPETPRVLQPSENPSRLIHADPRPEIFLSIEFVTPDGAISMTKRGMLGREQRNGGGGGCLVKTSEDS
ncbi:hypothetical protein EYF80_061333 [Liparis tanakae]|uniref:Uncharacterized protein n=1 Tax=Liparis tanakae TaxID=230148 RepID=A0A4Z2EIE4_9TELE|nr:hypothetical protein EYF80_061333 [Liparis tanakae]